MGTMQQTNAEQIIGSAGLQLIQENSDVCKLRIAIQCISDQLETNTLIYDTLDGTKRVYYLYKQDENESNDMHLKIKKSDLHY